MLKNLIVAIGENGEIGQNNQLLWKNKEDLKRFKHLTFNNTVIMGRNTMESLPNKNLYNRFNIVVSPSLIKQGKVSTHKNLIANSIEEALKIAENFNKDIFFIGGKRIYEEALPLCDKLFITKIKKPFPNADTIVETLVKPKNFTLINEYVRDGFNFQEYIKNQ